MNKLIISSFFLSSLAGLAVAEVTDVPNTFVADAPINATDMNNNFSHVIQQVTNVDSSLDARIVTIENAQASPSGSTPQLQGFTTVTIGGSAGIFTMTTLCQSEFPESRICSSDEVAKTFNIPSLPASTNAWILPVILTTYNGFADANNGDVTTTPASFNCNSWTSTTGQGLAVSNQGKTQRLTCGIARQVACCK